MKLFFTILLILIRCSQNVQAQQPGNNLYIEYAMEYNRIPQLSDEVNALMTNYIHVSAYTYSNGISAYKYQRVIKKDSSIVGRWTGRGRAFTTTYRDLTQRYEYCQHNVESGWVVRDTLLFDKKWRIKPGEKKVILGYACMKATDADDQTVWFCKDLPIPDGPQHYTGLPGLVLAVEASAYNMIAIRIDANASRDSVVLPIGYKYLTTKDFTEKINQWQPKE